jgi:hypothetical protein
VRTHASAEHPGTAVEWDGALYEVREAEPQRDGGMRYALLPWEEGHAIRRLERYDAASEEIREGERRDRRHDVAKRRASILLAPLLGLLPGEVQRKMARDFGAPAIAMTVSSALPLFVAGFLGLFGMLVRMAGGQLELPPWVAPPAALSAYLLLESALRLASAIALGDPVGTLAAELVGALAARRRASPAPAPPAPASDDVADEHDRELFHVLEPVLALLSPGEQETLVRRFGFDALRRGRATAAVLLAAAVLNTLVSASMLGAEDGFLRGLLWSLPALYLVIEQVRRWRAFARGRPAGSVLGALVRPFARPLLR